MEASSVEAQQPSGAVQELPPVEGEDLGGEGYSEAHVETYVTEGMPPDHGGQDEEEKEAVAAAAAAAGGSIAPLETCPTKLIINYLPQDATEQKLRDLFTQVAELESCKLVVNKQTGNSYGFAFVNYHTHEDALKAIERFNGEPIGNKNMKVSFARPQSDAIKGANLYIRNLPADADEAKLRGIFEKWGSIIQTKVLEPAAGSTDNRKTGFVRYNFRVEAEKAILELNGKIPAGGTEPLLVKFADQRAVSHGRGGRGGGGGLRDGMPSRGGGGGRSRGGHWDDGIGMSLAMLRGGRGGRPRSASGGQGRRGGPRGHGGPGRPEFHYRGGFTFAKSLGEGADPLLGHLGPAAAAQQRALHHLHPAGVPYGAGPAGYVPHHPHVLRSGEGHYPQYPIHAGHPAAAAGVPGVAPGVSPYEIPVGAGAHGAPFLHGVPAHQFAPQVHPAVGAHGDPAAAAAAAAAAAGYSHLHSPVHTVPHHAAAAAAAAAGHHPGAIHGAGAEHAPHVLSAAGETRGIGASNGTVGARSAAVGPASDSAAAASGGHVLFVYNIGQTMDEKSLLSVFGPFGRVTRVDVIRDPARGNKGKGYGFVTMATFEEAQHALEQMNGTVVQNRVLQVSFKNQLPLPGVGGPAPTVPGAAHIAGTPSHGMAAGAPYAGMTPPHTSHGVPAHFPPAAATTTYLR